jgi:diguanylate cyclase (GGDEF)-like protein
MMKRLILVIAILPGWASAAWASALAPLTTVQAIRALTNAEAGKGLPVAFQATVTYNRSYERLLFVQDGDAAIYIGYPTPLKLVPGDRVVVRGKTHKSFSPIVSADSVTLLGHGVVPKAEPASFDQMMRAETDGRMVTVRATIRAADQKLSPEAPVSFSRLQLLMDGGYFTADVEGEDAIALQGLLDADVELTGIASELFDSKMHHTGIHMYVQSLSYVKVIKRASSSPWSVPATPMDRVIDVYHSNDSTPRVLVHGTITYYLPGSTVVLQNGVKSIWINTLTYESLRIGDAADATGFPEVHDGFVNLTRGEIQDSHTPAPVTPIAVTWQTLSIQGYDSPGHHDDLVSIEGQVVTEVREDAQDELVLAVDGKLFSAIYNHPNGPVPDAKVIPLGSRIRVTGICIQENSDPFTAQIPFKILLRNYDDITVVAKPSILSIRNLILVVGILLVVVFAVIARGWLIERNVRRQITTMAEIERQRSRILEDINGSQSLVKILEEIVAMSSFRLEGAPCWCEVGDGSIMGNCPPEPHNLRIVRVSIEARSGPALGALFAALAPETPPAVREIEGLSSGARLATLAIETRRLYSDLRRRSEFDLLTDIYNRFSLHKRLDIMIQDAGQGGIFGLIYIDLDKFKPINDTFGHHVGDSYLQGIAMRMNDQLLGGDMLARLGGDEFAALVSLQRGRFDLEKIVARLEGCFDAPFVIEGHIIKGSASIGTAVYPEDGVTRDSLLSAADAAMYAVKKGKQQTAETPAEAPHPDPALESRA